MRGKLQAGRDASAVLVPKTFRRQEVTIVPCGGAFSSLSVVLWCGGELVLACSVSGLRLGRALKAGRPRVWQERPGDGGSVLG